MAFYSLVETIKIDKFQYGSKVEFMDLVIFKGNRFHQTGFFDIKKNNIYSNIVQETRVDAALAEVEGDFLQEYLPELRDNGEMRDAQTGTVKLTDKVVFSVNSDDLFPLHPNVDFSLGIVLPGKCYTLKKAIKDIFSKEFSTSIKKSTLFLNCFKNCNIGAVFRNETRIGALISKNKI